MCSPWLKLMALTPAINEAFYEMATQQLTLELPEAIF